MSVPVPAPSVLPTPYARTAPSGGARIDLWLDGNEGPPLDPEFVGRALARCKDVERLRRYPEDIALRAELAARFGVASSRVVLGAGADELLDRICRGWLAPGRALVAPVPCFPMLPRYVRAAGAELREVPWTAGPPPLEALARAAADATVLALTTPNNPTGLAIATDDLIGLARRLPACLLLVDLAYVEFADEDPTARLLELPNVLIVRTFSKARALAGLRVGYALGAEDATRVLGAVGSPYPCSSLSLALCLEALREDDPGDRLASVRRERSELEDALRRAGLCPLPSQANFVFAQADSTAAARALAARLARAGIAIRTFPDDDPTLARAVRITCPGSRAAFARLQAALAAEDER